MRTKSAATPAAIVVGFALLAIVIANALPATGQTEPPPEPAGRVPFQYSEGARVAGAGGPACVLVPIPEGRQVTIEGFSAHVFHGGTELPFVYLSVQKVPGSGLNVGVVRLELLRIGEVAVGRTLGGHALSLAHSHPVGQAGVTYRFQMCIKGNGAGNASASMMVSGYTEPLKTPSP